MNPWPRRAGELAATFMIGDGLLGCLQPERHVALWQDGALGAERTVAPFRGRPTRRRLYGLLQIGAGLWLASRLGPDDPAAAARDRSGSIVDVG